MRFGVETTLSTILVPTVEVFTQLSKEELSCQIQSR
jgi:hypothetical protein